MTAFNQGQMASLQTGQTAADTKGKHQEDEVRPETEILCACGKRHKGSFEFKHLARMCSSSLFGLLHAALLEMALLHPVDRSMAACHQNAKQAGIDLPMRSGGSGLVPTFQLCQQVPLLTLAAKACCGNTARSKWLSDSTVLLDAAKGLPPYFE